LSKIEEMIEETIIDVLNHGPLDDSFEMIITARDIRNMSVEIAYRLEEGKDE